jgi:hypothetical protein
VQGTGVLKLNNVICKCATDTCARRERVTSYNSVCVRDLLRALLCAVANAVLHARTRVRLSEFAYAFEYVNGATCCGLCVYMYVCTTIVVCMYA